MKVQTTEEKLIVLKFMILFQNLLLYRIVTEEKGNGRNNGKPIFAPRFEIQARNFIYNCILYLITLNPSNQPESQL